MKPLSGEILDSGRDEIRIHGGRQETYNNETRIWQPINNPELKKKMGCLRAYDKDMKEFKNIVDALQSFDYKEKPGMVNILDKLERIEKWGNAGMTDITIMYAVPSSELNYWQNFIYSLLNQIWAK